ncbi:hypothetical protein WJX81_006515 [Elliptochloris bilobata]|uniref:E3 ubiquitin-protein ligase listerin n=1 Tax=Elliptochloris bilobata TaxID=381761 RepID=A0AAW1RCB3_9CHLO
MAKGDRQKAKPSSAARAAELLGQGGGSAAFGFGGFSGAQPLGARPEAVPGGGAEARPAEPALTPGDLDSEMLQHLRRLSKRDPVTKLKALQALRELVPARSRAELEAFLPAWAKAYARLVMDNDRAVRTEASAVLGALAAGVGRGLAAALRPLAGPWWLAQFDPAAEAARAARGAFQAAFPGARQREALLFCRAQVVGYLEDNLDAAPGALGEPGKEAPEELAQRHERVAAASLLALASLLDLALGDSGGAGEAEAELVARVRALLGRPSALERMLGAKAGPVRRAAYVFVTHTCQRAPAALEGAQAEAAPAVLGALGERDPGCHAALWEMLFTFCRAFPGAWAAVDARKAVLPRLLSLLRHACYGSAEASLPALLPFVACLPRSLLGPSPAVPAQVVDALWAGWGAPGAGPGARAAAAAAFQDVLCWAIAQAPTLAGDQAQAYVRSLLDAQLGGGPVAAALTAPVDAAVASALRAVRGCAAQLLAPGEPAWAGPMLLEVRVARPAAAAVLPALEGDARGAAAAAALLALLIREHSVAGEALHLTPAAALTGCLEAVPNIASGRAGPTSVAARADVLLALLEKLDLAAVWLARSALLSAEPAAPEVLGRLLRMTQAHAWAAALAEGAQQALAATCWPYHVALEPPAERSSEAASGGARTSEVPACADDVPAERVWRAMAELAAACYVTLGVDATLVPSSSTELAWLPAEMLAAAEAEPALRATGAQTAEFLLDRDFDDRDQRQLVHSTLSRLLDAASARALDGYYLHMDPSPSQPEQRPLERLSAAQNLRELGSPALSALCSLLRALLAGSRGAARLARCCCRDRLVKLWAPGGRPAAGAAADGSGLVGNLGGPVPEAVALAALPVVAAALRCLEDGGVDLQESGLSAFSEARLADALALPPVVSALADAPDRVHACLISLRVVAACFPVHDNKVAPSSATSPAERAGLARLLQRQLAGERAAGAAAAAARRLQLPGAAAAPQGARDSAAAAEAEARLAALAACTLTYAWDQLPSSDREAVARRVRDGLAAAAVALEDAAEVAAAAAAAAAAGLASTAGPGTDSGLGSEGHGNDPQAMAPDLALAMLRRAGRTSSVHATRAFQAAVVEVEAAVMHGASSGSAASSVHPAGGSGVDSDPDAYLKADPAGKAAPLAGAPQAWARSLALLLAAGIMSASSSSSPPPASSAEPPGKRECLDAVGEALRLLFAGGVLAAIAAAAGPAAVAACNAGFGACGELWEAVAAVAEVAASVGGGSLAMTAAHAANEWAADTGVDAAEAAAALALSGQSGELADAALRLLLLPALLPKLARALPELEGLDADGAEVDAAGEAHPAAALAAAGVLPALAAAAANPDPDPEHLGPYLAAWAALLAHMLGAPLAHRRRLAAALHSAEGLVPALLDAVAPLLPLEEAAAAAAARRRRTGTPPPALAAAAAAAAAAEARAAGGGSWSLAVELQAAGVACTDEGVQRLAAAVFRGALRTLPASACAWFGALRDRALAAQVEAYTAARESPAILAAELGGLGAVSAAAGDGGGGADFSVRGSLGAREAVAVLAVEEGATLEMAVRLPPAWPLRPPTAECRRRVGMSEGRLRKWLLSMLAFLRSQNGSLADAMALWRSNCEREFAGVEECLICYAVVAPSNGQLPKLACHTCAKRFHGACMLKWFRSSGKSACPHCQSPW